MMNRSQTTTSSYPSSDPYISSDPNNNNYYYNYNIMSFAYQEEWNAQDNNQTAMIPNTKFGHHLQPPPPPLALPLTNTASGCFPFYSPLASDQYHHHSFIKMEEGSAGNLCGSTSGTRIGLNLGRRTYFSSGDALTIDGLLTARAHHQQPPRCQAEGCKADLSGSKHYHRRHKVCEFHSKATVVIAGGMQQRFCQQCSRFHVLAEFDESKRSCRKRLADHNRRRRKPPQTNSTNSSDNTTTTTKFCAATTSKDSTNNRTTAATHSGGFHEGTQGDHNKAKLSLGGSQAQQVLFNYHQPHDFSSQLPSTSNDSNFYRRSLFGNSSANIDDASSQSPATNGLHLRQSMFEVGFM